MAYIGVQPRLGNFQACDAITASATTTFNLLVGGTAIFPQSAQHCLVSLNGVLQAPISSYTISGSTIIFAAALTTDDSIDFITILGDTLDLGVPSDDTVGAAQIKADLISGTTALAAEPADTDEFLVSDAGVLKRIDYSLIKGGGITEADQWRITANHTSAAIVTSNWERNDSTGYSKIGTGLSESSGVFSFATTGIYLINFYGMLQMAATDGYVNFVFAVTTDNSSLTNVATALAGNDTESGDAGGTAANAYIFDVTNTSTHKFRFDLGSVTSGTYLTGSSTEQFTGFNMIRLGDT